LQKGLTTALNGVGTTVGTALSDYATTANKELGKVAGSLFGVSGQTLSQEISGLYNNVTQSITNLAGGNGFITNIDLLANQYGAADAAVAQATAAYSANAPSYAIQDIAPPF
jgi:hypothetical protein